MVMVFNATFNNISVISWWSVLLVKETGISAENHWPVPSHWQIYHIMLYRVHLVWEGLELTSVWKFYCRHHNLVNSYGISASQNDHGFVPLVITIQSFLHAWLVIRFLTRVIPQTPLLEQNLLTHPKLSSSPLLIVCSCYLIFSFLCSVMYINICFFVLYLLAIT